MPPFPFRKPKPLTTGQRGERAARRYLARRLYRIEAANFRCPGGEIDLVARKGRYLVFVEVKTREEDATLSGLEAVTPYKRHRLVVAARHYMTVTRQLYTPARFDVILVDSGTRKPSIRHFIDAFDGDTPAWVVRAMGRRRAILAFFGKRRRS